MQNYKIILELIMIIMIINRIRAVGTIYSIVQNILPIREMEVCQDSFQAQQQKY